jgi:hypothetical protein
MGCNRTISSVIKDSGNFKYFWLDNADEMKNCKIGPDWVSRRKKTTVLK